MVVLTDEQDRLAKRLKKVEFYFELCGEKPEVFVQIENQLADIKQRMVENKTDL